MSADRAVAAPVPGETSIDPLDARIIEQRARRIAQIPEAHIDTQTYSILTFRVGPEIYGIDLTFVAQVVKVSTMIQVPGAKPPFTGIFTLRGEIVSAFSLSEAVGNSQEPVTEQTRAVVCGTGPFRFALLADEVLQEMSVRADELATPETAAPLAGCARGITRDGIFVLDGEPLARAGGPLFTGS